MDFFFITDRHYPSSAPLPDPFVMGLAMGLQTLGHSATVCFPGNHRNDEHIRSVDGITILTQGTPFAFGNNAYDYWHDHRQGSLVVESITHRPWFVASRTPRHSSTVIIHHPHEERHHPITAATGMGQRWLQRYRPVRTIVTTPSTYSAFTNAGFEHVRLIPPAPTISSPQRSPRSLHPLWLSPDPVTPASRAEELVTALGKHRETFPTAQLWLVANPHHHEYQQRVVETVRTKKLSEHVRWLEPTDLERHPEILGRVWSVIVTTAPDAGTSELLNAFQQATPAIVYDTPGIGDAVEHNQTGLVIRPRASDLSEALNRLGRLRSRRELMGVKAKEYARRFSWETSARRFLDGVGIPR